MYNASKWLVKKVVLSTANPSFGSDFPIRKILIIKQIIKNKLRALVEKRFLFEEIIELRIMEIKIARSFIAGRATNLALNNGIYDLKQVDSYQCAGFH